MFKKINQRKGFAPIIIIVLVALALAAAGGATYFARRAKIKHLLVCTAEAKQCPDGSYVSRTGPNCKFADCPSAISMQDIIANWKTYLNEKYGFELKLPRDWIVDDFNSYGFDGGVGIRSPHSSTETYPWVTSILVKFGNYQNSRKAFEIDILPALRKDIDHKVSDIKFNDYDAISFVDLGIIDTQNIVFIQDGRMIKISYISDQRDAADNRSQILSTFKFIK